MRAFFRHKGRSVLLRVAITVGTVAQMALLYGLLVGFFVAGEVHLGFQHEYGLAVVGWGGVFLLGMLLFFSLRKRLGIAAFDWITVAIVAAAEALYAVLSLFAFVGALVLLYILGIIEK